MSDPNEVPSLTTGPPSPEHRNHRFPVDGCWRCEVKAELMIVLMELHLEMGAEAPPRQR